MLTGAVGEAWVLEVRAFGAGAERAFTGLGFCSVFVEGDGIRRPARKKLPSGKLARPRVSCWNVMEGL